MARLLIIDDNANIRFLMRSFVEQSGHVVCGEAQDGVEGIETARQTDPDLILLDFTMPIMNGVETAAILKTFAPDTPIILFTLFAEEINKKWAAMMGADMVVNKTDGIPKIGSSIRTLLARKMITPKENTDTFRDVASSESRSASKKGPGHH